MSRRAPSRPPEIEGLRHLALIGSGGFADVFLYEDLALRREVAVKVLAELPSAAERAAFAAEANVMAQLSSHPAIVSIYQVGTAADGRPFLTMEHCPGASLATRLRRESLAVPLVLDVAVKTCAAVETAHRAGVLHRDIKPANILTTAFGDPMLTDFGIAHVLSEGVETVTGFSVPWSPPEVFAETVVADHRSDVWGLAATVYTLLAGRSPFEVAGGANDAASLMHRIETVRLPRLGRPDVPTSLEDLLVRGMAKRPEERHPSAMALARGLQEVQIQLHVPTTRIDVLDASAAPADRGEDDQDGTSVRPISVIHPEGARPRRAPESRAGVAPRPLPPVDDTWRPGQRRPSQPGPVFSIATDTSPDTEPGPTLEGTAPTSEHPVTGVPVDVSGRPPAQEGASRPGGRPLVAGLLVGAAAAAVVAVLGVALLGDDAPTVATNRLDTGTTRAPVAAAVDVPVPLPPVAVAGVRDGRTVSFSWGQDDPQPGDSFRWTLAGDGGEPAWTLTDRAAAQVEVPAGRRPCIVVTVVRSGQQSTPSPLTCAAAP